MSTSESGRRTFHLRLNEMVEQLRDGIRNGTYMQGSYLPTEKALAKQFGLSNKTVRKGLEQLSSEGLIDKIPRVGSIVTKPDSSAETIPAVSSRPPVTLMVGCYSLTEREMLPSRVIDDFHEQFPSIRVQFIALNPDKNFMDTMKPCLDNGLIDAFTVKDRHFSQLVEAGYTFALEPQPNNAQLYPFLTTPFIVEHTLFAQPLVFSPLVLAYNLQHFRESGVTEPDASWTWEDAIRYASQLSAPGLRYGLHFQVLLDERWPIFLLQSESDAHSTGSKSGLGIGEKWLEGIRLSKNIIRNHDIYPHSLYGNEGDVGNLFLQGKTSMIMTSYEALNRFSKSRLEYDISSLPYIHEPRTLVTVTAIAVNKQSKHKPEAQCLADYLASPRAQQLIREHTLSIPSLKPAAEAPVVGEQPLNRPSRYNLYRDTIPGFRTYDDLKLPAAAIRPLHDTLKKYWSDLIDERTLCEEIDAIAASSSLRPAQAGQTSNANARLG
ncbi:MAG: GntR family transcriptional regulator [Paenibacillus sp.]|nr:GntR family transcriptional regulator [Paenibacillus sp.]